MSDDIPEELTEETKEVTSVIEVKVVNPPEVKEKKSDFDSVDANEYEDMYPTKEQIKEYEEE